MKLNSKLTSDEWKSAFLKEYLPKSTSNLPGVQVFTEPFHCVQISEFCELPAFLEVSKSLSSVALYEKHNDLYKFHQSADLKTLTDQPMFQQVRSFFLQEILPWLTECTQVPLMTGQVDLTVSQYKYTDVLLCHDDRLEGRRIAFVWYFVDEDWSEEDGGHLDMIESDEKLRPHRVVHSFLPKRNSLLFFEVTSRSFHQVREVLNVDKVRWSINGWFHGPPAFEDVEDPGLVPPMMISPQFIEECLLQKWVNPRYLDENVTLGVATQWQDNGGVMQLATFFNEGVYRELCESLEGVAPQCWQLLGPMNARQMQVLDTASTSVPPLVLEMIRVLTSQAMMVLLTTFTQLPLAAPGLECVTSEETTTRSGEADECGPSDRKRAKTDANLDTNQEEGGQAANGTETEDDSPTTFVYGECSEVTVRQWRHGLYSCIRDCDVAEMRLGGFLRLVFYCGWPAKWDGGQKGGALCAFLSGKDELRFQLDPAPNTVSLYVKDEDCLDFVSYMNCRTRTTPESCFDCVVDYFPLDCDSEEEEETEDEGVV